MEPVRQCYFTETKLLPDQKNEVVHVSLFMSDYAPIFNRPVCEVRELPEWDKPAHVINDKEAQKYIQTFHRYGPSKPTTDKMCPFQGGSVRENLSSLVGDNTLVTQFEGRSNNSRSILSSFFTKHRLESFKTIWKDIAEKWVDKVTDQAEVSLFDSAQQLICRCVIEGILGLDACSDEDVDLNVSYWKSLLSPASSKLKTAKEFEEERENSDVFDMAFGFLQSGFEFTGTLYPYAVLSHFLGNLSEKIYTGTVQKEGSLCHYLTQKKYTKEEILANIKGFLIAAQETTGSLLGFIVYEYAKNSELQEKSFANPKEIHNVYLEALRLYATGGVNREAGTDLILTYQGDKQHYIRQGDVIVCMPYLSGHSDEWANPETFNPKRKNLQRVKDALPFGSGAHHCIGEKVAELEIKTLLETLLSLSTFTTTESLPRLINAFSLKPEHDIPVTFKLKELS